jgi:hypothetical protein
MSLSINRARLHYPPSLTPLEINLPSVPFQGDILSMESFLQFAVDHRFARIQLITYANVNALVMGDDPNVILFVNSNTMSKQVLTETGKLYSGLQRHFSGASVLKFRVLDQYFVPSYYQLLNLHAFRFDSQDQNQDNNNLGEKSWDAGKAPLLAIIGNKGQELFRFALTFLSAEKQLITWLEEFETHFSNRKE